MNPLNPLNPLDIPGKIFRFEARNITARAASSKDGPKYKIGIEVDKSTFDTVITANVEGAVFVFVCNRVDLDADTAPPANDSFVEANRWFLSVTPTGPRCREAVGLMKEKDFADYIKFVNMDYNGNDTPKEFVQITCGIKSRREFDEGRDADGRYAEFCKLKTAYRQWQGRKK